MRSVGLIELEEVFLTHFHADHVLGLPGMLKTFALRQRERELTVYGPRGLMRLFEQLAPVVGRLPFPLELLELEPNDELDRDGYRIAAFAVDHGGRGLGYALVEDPRPGVFDPARARELGVTPGPGLRPPPARRDGGRGGPGAGHGRGAARAQARPHGRHGARAR